MSTTRSNSDKEEIDKAYNAAISNLPKDSKYTYYTSTPATNKPETGKTLVFEDIPEEGDSVAYKTAVGSFLDSTTDQTEVCILKSGATEVTESFVLKFDESSIKPKVPTLTKDLDDKLINSLVPSFETKMSTNPFATLKYALEAVPFFDGKNTNLTYFIEGCEEAMSMLPPEAEAQFTKIIRTRIVGEARRTIQGENFDTIADLTKYLEEIYGQDKNVYQLQGELGRIYQKNEEDVITYANRVKFLGNRIHEAHKKSGNNSTTVRSSIETDMSKCFIRGLKPEIEQRITRGLNINETVNDALRIERELREITDIRQGKSYSLPKSTDRSRETCQLCHKEGHNASSCRRLNSSLTNNNNVPNEILICQICRKRGHSADKCRQRETNNRRFINVINENISNCQICDKPGHNAKSCRLNKPSLVCQWCDRSGHTANDCWKKQQEQRGVVNRTRITCQICNRYGHSANECQSNTRQNNKKDSEFCRYCKKNGHVLDNCELRIANNKRREAFNAGNASGPSKTGVQQGSNRISHPITTQKK